VLLPHPFWAVETLPTDARAGLDRAEVLLGAHLWTHNARPRS